MSDASTSAPAQTSAPAAAQSSASSAPASSSGSAAQSKPSGPSPRLPATNPVAAKPYEISFDDATVNTAPDTDVQSDQPTAGSQPPKEPGTQQTQTKPSAESHLDEEGLPKGDKWKGFRESHKALKVRAAELEAKLKTFETSPQGESKVLAEKLTAAEQRVQDYEYRLRETDYERSDDYRQQFIKPIEENYAKLTRAMESWDVTETDGTIRPATEGDFQALMTMTDRQAKQVARERFGADAPEVLALRASLVDATQKRQEAVKSFKANSEARQKDQTAKQAQTRQAHQSYWENANKILTEKAPDMFAEGQDQDENAALKEGFGIWDKAYGPGDVPPQVRINHQALVRNSVGFAARAKVRIDKLSTQLKAANDELAKYRGSEPGRGDIHHADGKPSRNGYKTIDQQFAEP